MSVRNLPARESRVSRLGWGALNALQLAFTVAWTAVLIVPALAVRAFAGPGKALRMASRLWAPALLLGAGAELRVEGLEGVDWSRPLILASNHQSMIDVCALFRAVPVPLRFVLKRELAAVPIVGGYARAMGMVFLDRANPRKARDELLSAVGALRAGAAFCAFPEGTRSRDGRIAPFKGGPFQLAIAAGVPVVPVAILGSGEVLPANGFRVRPGAIRVRFGAPLPTAGLRAEDRRMLAARAQQAVAALNADRRSS